MDAENVFKFTINMCRLCKYIDNHMESIFDAFYGSKFLVQILSDVCNKLEVAKNDGLPENICQACRNRLISAYEFQILCLKTDEELRTSMKNADIDIVQFKQEVNLITDDDTEHKELVKSAQHFELVNVGSVFDDSEVKVEIEAMDNSSEGDNRNDGDTSDNSSVAAPASSHPKIKSMIIEAIKELKDPSGSSIQAIKKYMDKKFNVNVDQKIAFIKKYLKYAVDNGEIIQMKGTGLKASFKMNKNFVPPTKDFNQKPQIPSKQQKRKEKRTCPICLKSVVKFYSHLRIHTEDEIKVALEYLQNEVHTCLYCNKEIRSEKALKYHIRHSHSKETMSNKKTDKNKKECQVCFIKVNDIKKHMEIHEKVKLQLNIRPRTRDTANPLTCDICDKQFPLKEILRNHMRIHRIFIKCSNCQEEVRKSELQDHVNNACKNNVHVCKICNEVFSEKIALDRHKTENHESPLICTYCGKTFLTKYRVQQHMWTHSEDFRFACSLCPKKFNMDVKLKKHMRSHDKGPRLVCDICGSSYKNKKSLRVHKIIHSDTFQYSCEYCDKKFHRSQDVVRHQRTHTGEKAFKCTFCGDAFTNHGDWFRHKRLHLGDNMYQCEICSQYFKYKKDYNEHITVCFVNSQKINEENQQVQQ